jgi:hypothetical protein
MGTNAQYVQIQYRGISPRYRLVYGPGGVAAIPGHEGTVGSDAAVTCACLSLALAELEHRCPEVSVSCSGAPRRQEKLLPGARHSLHALHHSVHSRILGAMASRTSVGQREITVPGARP